MRLDETIWDYMRIYMTIWDNIRLYETIWDYMRLYETRWDYMRLDETRWDYMRLHLHEIIPDFIYTRLYQPIWDYMRLYETISDYTNSCTSAHWKSSKVSSIGTVQGRFYWCDVNRSDWKLSTQRKILKKSSHQSFSRRTGCFVAFLTSVALRISVWRFVYV